MDAVGQDAGLPGVPMLLTRVLKNYQSSALSSLSGPGAPLAGPQDMEGYRKAILNAKSHKKDKEFVIVDPFMIPPPFPIQQMPVFTPVDTGRAERSDTYLEGETIACFYVGGELRLCLPQILNTVLRDFSLQQINTICDELHIFCSRCNPDQLETLKATGVLPYTAASCGLITKTDAERLCNALLHSVPERRMDPPSAHSLRVYHECFGKGKGLLDPDLYTSPKASCIQCTECEGMFSPEKFVGHFHRASENRTCHWGFDSANWRHYLLLAKEQEDRDRAQDVLDRIKARFDSAAKYKRKSSPDREGLDWKRHKITASPGVSPLGDERMAAVGQRVLSAFQPWSPSILAIKDPKLIPAPPAIMREGYPGIRPAYLKTGPPVLQNPERVVPYSESERYERHFTPNVALAPVSVQKKDGDQDENKEEEDDCFEVDPVFSLSKETKPPKAVETTSTKSTPPQQQYCDQDMHNTDTDDSSYSNPSPGSEHLRPDATILNKEMEMVRSLVYGQALTTEEERTHFVHEYTKLRTQQEDMLNAANTARRRLKEELADCKKVHETMAKENAMYRIQIDSMSKIYETQRRKLERSLQELLQENHTMRAMMEKEGIKFQEVLDLRPHENGTSRSPTPQRSSSFSPGRMGDLFLAGASHIAKTLPPKKDREIAMSLPPKKDWEKVNMDK